MDKLYDEKVFREVSPAPWSLDDPSSVDTYYLRVRLFKAVAVDRRGMHSELWTVYLRVSEDTIYAGSPDENIPGIKSRQGKTYLRTRTYTTGPDSKRIRECVESINEFNGQRVENSN